MSGKLTFPATYKEGLIAEIKRTGTKILVVVAVCPQRRVSRGAVWCAGRMFRRKVGKPLPDRTLS